MEYIQKQFRVLHPRGVNLHGPLQMQPRSLIFVGFIINIFLFYFYYYTNFPDEETEI